MEVLVLRKLAASALAAATWATSPLAVAPPAYAARASNAPTSAGSRVNKDAESLLRFGLPVKSKEVRDLQKAVEEIKDNLRAKRISAAIQNVQTAERLLGKTSSKIVDAAPASRKEEVASRLEKVKATLGPISTALADLGQAGSPQERDALDQAGVKQAEAATLISEIEVRLVPEGYKAVVPEEYSDLPRLNGRARVEFVVKKADKSKYAVDGVLYDKARLEMIVDGYTAPLTSGNFLDLVSKKYYDGMEIQRADGFVVQTGDPDGPDNPLFGYSPDGGKTVRQIPLEIAVDTDKDPMYGITTEDDGRGSAQTKLPFQAYGALGMARSEYDADSASSQFFFLLFDSDLTPAGKNLLDGRYACFGYTVKNEDFLAEIKEGDIIESARIINAPAPFGSYAGLDP